MSTDRETARFWNLLMPLVEEERVIPIVGPDLLTIRDGQRSVLLYDWLALQLAVTLGVTDIEAPTLNSVTCRHLSDGGVLDEVYIALKGILAAQPIPTPSAMEKLAGITSFKLYVSTTFDSLLFQAVNNVRRAGRAPAHALAYALNNDFEDLPGAMSTLDRPVVYQIMGRVSAIKQTYAVTDEDVLEFVHSLQLPEGRPKHLFDSLAQGHLLLIGSNLSGWLTRFFLRTVKDKERLWQVRDRAGFVADTGAASDAELRQFLRHFSDRTLVYPSGGAVEFVDELSQRWAERHPQGTTQEPAQMPVTAESMPRHAVFLSYAREDRTIVDSIKRDLDAHGIDAWFDRKELKPGDYWAEKLRANIDACSVFIPVISGSVLGPQAREFRAEWEHALAAVKRRPRQPDGSPARFIFPIVIDTTDMQTEGVREYFGAIQAEKAPSGKLTPDLLALVKELVRKAQKVEGAQ